MSTEERNSWVEDIDNLLLETVNIVDSLLEITNDTVINIKYVYEVVKTALRCLKQIEEGLGVEEAVNFCHCTNDLLVSLVKFFLEKSNNNSTTLEDTIQGSIGVYKEHLQTLNVFLGSMELKNKDLKIESEEKESEIEKESEKLEKETEEPTNVKPIALRGQELLVYINNLGNKFPVGSSIHEIVLTVSSSLEGVLNGLPVPSTILLEDQNISPSMPFNILTSKILNSYPCQGGEGGDSPKTPYGTDLPSVRDNTLLRESGRVIKRQISALSGKLKEKRKGSTSTTRTHSQRNLWREINGKKENLRFRENLAKENSGKENSGKENFGKENSGKENFGEKEIEEIIVDDKETDGSRDKETDGSREEEVQQDLLDIPGKTENFSKRKFIVEEIVNSENSYLEGLKILTNVYKYSVIEEGYLTEEEMELILLPYLDSIIEMSQFLVNAFEERLVESGGSFQDMPVGYLFLSVEVELLNRYSPYILDYEQAITNLMKFKKITTFSTFLQTLQESPETKFRNIDDYQITVIQRLPRYVLLLTDLLKHTPKEHQDYEDLSRALEGIKTGVDNINSEKRVNQMRNFGREIIDAFGFDDMASSILFYEANLFKDQTTNYTSSIQKWQYKILFYDDDQIILIKYKQDLLELVKRVSLSDAKISQYTPPKKKKEKDLGSKKAIKFGNTVYYTSGSDVRKQLLQVYTEMLASSPHSV